MVEQETTRQKPKTDKYNVIKYLGGGTFGAVWSAEDNNKKKVALKQIFVENTKRCIVYILMHFFDLKFHHIIRRYLLPYFSLLLHLIRFSLYRHSSRALIWKKEKQTPASSERRRKTLI